MDDIIAQFLNDIDMVTRDRFNRNYKVDKGLEDEKSVKHIDKNLIDRILGLIMNLSVRLMMTGLVQMKLKLES